MFIAEIIISNETYFKKHIYSIACTGKRGCAQLSKNVARKNIAYQRQSM